LTEGQIRLRYSGLVFFFFRLFSVGTGLLFTLMLTRSITLEEYGIYSNLNDILSYFTLSSSIIPFWVTRFIARQRPGAAETGLVMNILIAAISAASYLLVIPWAVRAMKISWVYLPAYIAGAIVIFGSHLVAVLEAILYSKRPETLGFGIFIFETSRVLLGLSLLIALRLGLIGAIIGLAAAFLIQSLFYLLKYLLREFKFGLRVRWDYVREWLKASAINVYGIVSGRILALANIFLFIYAGELSRAYYGAASAIASIIGYSSSLAFALYPKLLSKADTGHEDVVLSLKMVLMFAAPMAVGAITLSEELLSILNVSYSVAKPILIILATDALLSAFSSIFGSIVSGTEKFDIDTRILFRDIVKSKLFLLLTLHYVQATIVALPAYIFLSSVALNALEAAEYLALITLIANIFITMARYMIAKRCLEFRVPWLSIGKYFAASIIMALILHVFQMPARLLFTLFRIFFGALIYFAALLKIDKEAREFLSQLRKRQPSNLTWKAFI